MVAEKLLQQYTNNENRIPNNDHHVNPEDAGRNFRHNAQNNAQLKKRNHLQKMPADKISVYDRLSQPRNRNSRITTS